MGDEKQKIKFPDGFLWGAATSAHQVEGGNRNDWSEWETANASKLADKAKNLWKDWQQEKFPEMFEPENYISGRACDHYNRYESDFDIAKSLGHNAHRFSIEWSRIEPEEGKFDEREIEHYKKIVKALKNRGIEPFVTLWHWTNPLWIRDIGGWENKKTIEYFLRYTGRILEALPEVNFWVTLNEPTVYTSLSYIKGTQPPGKKNIFIARRVINNLVKAHRQLYDLIHEKNKNAQVSSTAYSVNYWLPYKNKIFSRIFSGFMNWLEGHFLNKINDKSDFIGMQYYRSITVGLKSGGNFWGIIDTNLNSSGFMSDLGWSIYPEGIYYFLKKFKKYNRPIYITENGLADAGDSQRGKFIKEHLYWINKAMREGVDVRGYFHWSLLDNFEFVDLRGFWPRFGLVEVDYKTLERKPRKSAWEYAKITKSNELEM